MGNTIAIFPIIFSLQTNFYYFKTYYKLELVEAERKSKDSNFIAR